MFADVTARETGRRAARRAAWLLGSTVLQGALVVVTAAASLWLRPAAPDDPLQRIVAPVIIHREPRPPAPPAPAPRRSEHLRPDVPPALSSALVQPREVPETAPLDPGPPEPALPAGDGEPSSVNSGGFGPAAPATQPEEAVDPGGAGYRPPAMAAHHCVQRSVRIPRDLSGFVSGPITVKFAIGRDAAPSRFSVMTPGVPDRVATAIWQAVQECRWIAGGDPGGRPVAIWVVMPLRFQGE